jgi:hypothetical protein
VGEDPVGEPAPCLPPKSAASPLRPPISSALPSSTILQTSTALAVWKSLTGKAPSDIPGVLLAPGAIVSSVGDEHTKPRDVYAVTLAAGQTLQVQVDVSGSASYSVAIANPDSRTFQSGGWTGQTPCSYAFAPCSATFTPAVAGTYFLAIVAQSPTVSYALHVTVH